MAATARTRLTARLRVLAAFGIVATLATATACRHKEESDSGIKDVEASPAADPFRGKGSFPIWAYDAGPNPNDPMGKALIDLNARIPYFPGLSKAIYGDQMFRPAFGPIAWRMMQKPNSVKILFIGQDGTHIAEAAGRPATAGFGGRAQDLAKHFGVGSSAAFINTYAYTIRWQYGAFDTPMLSKMSGSWQYNTSSFTGNQVWAISQDLDSPLVKWRNDLISWIIENNRESLKLVVLFGGGARDAMASYVVSKGGKVGTRFTEEDLKNIKIPEYELTGAGSNKQTAFPLSQTHRDLYREFNNNSMPPYTDPARIKTLQGRFRTAFNQDPETWMAKMVVPGEDVGLNGSGMLHPAQLGGYSIDEKMEINGQVTKSLKGLRVSDSFTIGHDILVTQLPHPTALSMMEPDAASAAVDGELRAFEPYRATWTIDADTPTCPAGLTPQQADETCFFNWFADRKSYFYGRGDMGPEYYDFGAPNSRMVNVSSASRSGPDVIVFGTRDRAGFDTQLLKKMGTGPLAKSTPAQSDRDMWIARPSEGSARYTFDPGPGDVYAKLMKTSLPDRGSDFWTRARLINGDFGHYRGTFKDPQVVIIADPHGEDDLITARALTGSRGQYLQTLMDSMGVKDKYLVLKTAPFSVDANWADTVDRTKGYRDALFKRVLDTTTPKLIIVDGPSAIAEFDRIFGASPPAAKVVKLTRSTDPAHQDNASAGISGALAEIQTVPGFEGAAFSSTLTNIPRSHLTYYARTWEGTSGDRVITSNEERYRGIAFAEVAPAWAYKQKYKMPDDEVLGCKALAAKLNTHKLRMGLEKIGSYSNRLLNGTPGAADCDQLATFNASPTSDGSPGGQATAQGGDPGNLEGLDQLIHVEYDDRPTTVEF